MDNSKAGEGRRDAVMRCKLATPKPAVKNGLKKRASTADNGGGSETKPAAAVSNKKGVARKPRQQAVWPHEPPRSAGKRGLLAGAALQDARGLRLRRGRWAMMCGLGRG